MRTRPRHTIQGRDRPPERPAKPRAVDRALVPSARSRAGARTQGRTTKLCALRANSIFSMWNSVRAATTVSSLSIWGEGWGEGNASSGVLHHTDDPRFGLAAGNRRPWFHQRELRRQGQPESDEKDGANAHEAEFC